MAKEEESKRELQAVQAELIKAEVTNCHLRVDSGSPPPPTPPQLDRGSALLFRNECEI